MRSEEGPKNAYSSVRKKQWKSLSPQVPKLSSMHVFHSENSTSLKFKTVIHACFTLPRTQNGMNELTSLKFKTVIHACFTLPRTQNGMNELTSLKFRTVIHACFPLRELKME
jgi:hypothetical protein